MYVLYIVFTEETSQINMEFRVGEGGILTDIDWVGRGFFLLMKFEDFSSPGLLTVWEVPKGFLDTNGHYDNILFSE